MLRATVDKLVEVTAGTLLTGDGESWSTADPGDHRPAGVAVIGSNAYRGGGRPIGSCCATRSRCGPSTCSCHSVAGMSGSPRAAAGSRNLTTPGLEGLCRSKPPFLSGPLEGVGEQPVDPPSLGFLYWSHATRSRTRSLSASLSVSAAAHPGRRCSCRGEGSRSPPGIIRCAHDRNPTRPPSSPGSRSPSRTDPRGATAGRRWHERLTDGARAGPADGVRPRQRTDEGRRRLPGVVPSTGLVYGRTFGSPTERDRDPTPGRVRHGGLHGRAAACHPADRPSSRRSMQRGRSGRRLGR